MNKKNNRFQIWIFTGLAILFLSYLSYKIWHISLAIEAFQGQEIIPLSGQPAK